MPVGEKSHAKYLWISIVASIATILLKGGAYFVTASVGLLSDAIESFINLAAGVSAFALLTIALRPPDRGHPFGHNKAEYFSSIIEGTLIFLAAVAICVTSIERLINPHPPHDLGTGLLISVAASVINLFTAMILMKAGKRYNSITLEADARHLLTDVWTTGGVLAGLLVVNLTGWIILDPIIAIFVAVNIIFTGIGLIRRSVSGLMDEALPADEIDLLRKILDSHKRYGVVYHSLYTRKAASKRFVSLHLVMPGEWQISKGHELTKLIESEISRVFPETDVFIHIEPMGDPAAFDDYLDSYKEKG